MFIHKLLHYGQLTDAERTSIASKILFLTVGSFYMLNLYIGLYCEYLNNELIRHCLLNIIELLRFYFIYLGTH